MNRRVEKLTDDDEGGTLTFAYTRQDGWLLPLPPSACSKDEGSWSFASSLLTFLRYQILSLSSRISSTARAQRVHTGLYSLTVPAKKMKIPQPSYQHHTVPICGAPFVPPVLGLATNGFHDNAYASSSSSSTERSSFSSSTPPSPPYSSGSLSSSPSSSSSEYSSGPSSPVDSYPSPTRQAALTYSKQLHAHTNQMWAKERLNIEKSRLEMPGSPVTTCTRGIKPKDGYIRYADPTPLPAARRGAVRQARETQTGAAWSNIGKQSALDSLLDRAKSLGSKGSRTNLSGGKGHQRGASLH